MKQRNMEIRGAPQGQTDRFEVTAVLVLVTALGQFRRRLRVNPRVKMGRVVDDRGEVEAEFGHHLLGQRALGIPDPVGG